MKEWWKRDGGLVALFTLLITLFDVAGFFAYIDFLAKWRIAFGEF